MRTDLPIVVERRGHEIWITVNRPAARNALTIAMWDRLGEVAREIAADPTVRVAVFTGAGDKAFVSGTDIAEFRSFSSGDDAVRYEAHMNEIITAIEEIPIPTIAAIRGFCTGGGASIAGTCDLRIATPHTRVGYPVAKTLGNCLSVRNYARLEQLIGESKIKELVFTARLADAHEAHRIGFLTEIVSDEELNPRVEALAATIAANAPLTLRATKEELRRIALRENRIADADLVEMCYTSADFRSGMTAFLEKRAPAWTGA